ncbi:MAG: DivIVA domain-containing protein [Oscillospiraceae bacterium]|nr:DivIVA domain-containing protein [Oscillospiraceae bacterium]
MLTSQEIRSTAFEITKRGYTVQDVDSFLKKVAGEFDALQSECAAMLQEKDRAIEAAEAEKADMERKMLILADKLEEYRAQESLIQNALLNAERMKESLLGEARQTGEILLRDAQQKADKLLENANRKVAAEQQTYLRMQQEVAKFKTQVLDIYKTHLAVISALPDGTEEMVDFPAIVTDAEQPAAELETEELTVAEEAVETVVETAETVETVECACEEVAEETAEAAEEVVETAAEPIVQETVEQIIASAEQAAAEEAPKPEQYDGFAPRSMVNNDSESKSRFSQLEFGDKFSFGK